MQEVPYGYCHCGCGQKAPISPQTHSARGYVKGEPRKYIAHHYRTGPRKRLRWIEQDTGHSSPCHIWQMKVDDLDGYAREWCSKRKRERRAHLLAYERTYGDVPDGLEVHHACGMRACVNPEHLVAVDRTAHAAATHSTRWERRWFWSGCP